MTSFCPSSTTDLSTPKLRVRAIWINATLWTFQGWLIMFYVAAGYAKLSEPMTNLVFLMGWPQKVSETFVRGLGAAEIVLGLLMLAPVINWKVGRPLVVMGAAALAVMQIVFLGFHLGQMDLGFVFLNLLLLAITTPVFWLRRCTSS